MKQFWLSHHPNTGYPQDTHTHTWGCPFLAPLNWWFGVLIPGSCSSQPAIRGKLKQREAEKAIPKRAPRLQKPDNRGPQAPKPRTPSNPQERRWHPLRRGPDAKRRGRVAGRGGAGGLCPGRLGEEFQAAFVFLFEQGSLKDTLCPIETWLFPPK